MKSFYSLLFVSVLLLSCNSTNKQKTSEEKNTETELAEDKNEPTATFISETLNLTHCESAVYDAKRDIIYASLIGKDESGDGSIATIGLDGTLINSTFVSGLNDPKGIAISENKIYVTDITELVEADINTGKIIKKHTVEGTSFLNDVAVASDGSLYVSDTRTSQVYKLDNNGVFSLWLEDPLLDNPNGLLIQGETIYVASWGSSGKGGRVSKINMNDKKIDTITEKLGNLDGIRPFDKNHLIISDWRSGNIHLVDMDTGETQEVVTVGETVGDIAYIKEKNLLLLPMNRQSRLLFYKL